MESDGSDSDPDLNDNAIAKHKENVEAAQLKAEQEESKLRVQTSFLILHFNGTQIDADCWSGRKTMLLSHSRKMMKMRPRMRVEMIKVRWKAKMDFKVVRL